MIDRGTWQKKPEALFVVIFALGQQGLDYRACLREIALRHRSRSKLFQDRDFPAYIAISVRMTSLELRVWLWSGVQEEGHFSKKLFPHLLVDILCPDVSLCGDCSLSNYRNTAVYQ
jgi:hypothetical protein